MIFMVIYILSQVQQFFYMRKALRGITNAQTAAGTSAL